MMDDLFASLKTLEVQDLGVVRKFLSMRVEFENGGLTLDHENLMHHYLDAQSMTDASAVSTATVLHKDTEGDKLLDDFQVKTFRSLTGGLLWLARCARPDIAFVVLQMTRRTHAPLVADACLGKRVWRYLAGTASMKLRMTKSTHHTLALSAFTDADYAGQDSDRKSISAATIHLIDLLVNWYCTKQNNVSISQWNRNLLPPITVLKNFSGITKTYKKSAASRHG
jgi:hypothetical protein